MKKIKAMNGYTVYMATERDEKRGTATAGEFSIYYSADVREYGREYSDPVFEGVGSWEEVVELTNNNEGRAYSAVSNLYTCIDFETLETYDATEALDLADEIRRTCTA